MNQLLEPLLSDKQATLDFFNSLRADGIRYLVHRYHLSVKVAEEAVECLVDQIFEDHVKGFIPPLEAGRDAYCKSLLNYLIYQILPRRAVDLIRSGQQKYSVSAEELAWTMQMPEAEVLDLLGCFEVQTQACERIEQVQVIQKLNECLASLSEKLKLIAYGVLADHTFEHIAQIEQISVGTVKSRSFEMYKKLRMCMQVTTAVKS